MIRKLIKATLVRASELIFAIGLVVLFFAIVLGVYALSFPEGASLSDLFRRNDVDAKNWSDSRVSLTAGRSPIDDPLFVAHLTHVQRTVKDKPDGVIAWTDSEAGIRLGDRHAIQSFSGSAAVITFDDRSDLRMGENSLVVLKSTDRLDRTRQRVASVVLLDGQLSGRIGGFQDEPMRIEVVTANATVRMDTSPDKPADFAIIAESDDTSTYTIHEGVAQVRTDNSLVEVGPEESITIDENGVISWPQLLPETPELDTPPEGYTAYYRTAPPQITFRWQSSRQVDAFHFELTRDPTFRDVLHHEVLSAGEFVHGHLKPGLYYWRVSSIVDSARSQPSRSMSLVVEQDREAPSLHVRFPEETVGASVFEIEGHAEPGADVFVDDHRVEVQADGQFVHPVPLQRGLNVVVVEAVDIAGNVSYESRVIHATYPVEERGP